VGAAYRNEEFLKKYEDQGMTVNILAGTHFSAALKRIAVNPK
jgi:hypothetical protein